MKRFPMIARILLGLVFFASGVIGFFNLIPPPSGMPEKLQAFMTGLLATGYFMPLLKLTEIVCGALLIAGVFVPLALVVLAPVVLNILFVHLLLDPSGLPVALVICLLEIYLAFFAQPYKATVRSLFRQPGRPKHVATPTA